MNYKYLIKKGTLGLLIKELLPSTSTTSKPYTTKRDNYFIAESTSLPNGVAIHVDEFFKDVKISVFEKKIEGEDSGYYFAVQSSMVQNKLGA